MACNRKPFGDITAEDYFRYAKTELRRNHRVLHANDIALLLFGIGLTLTLVYIALDLIHALESKDLLSKRESVNEH
jgi:hypothetical protein